MKKEAGDMKMAFGKARKSLGYDGGAKSGKQAMAQPEKKKFGKRPKLKT